MSRMQEDDEFNELDERPSKSQRKRDSDELQALGEALIELPAAELDALPLPDKLREAVDLAKRITAHGGLYRQKQYIGKLMRKLDATPIRDALEAKRQRHRTEVLRIKKLEAWRNRLLNEPDALQALLDEYPDANRAEFERLIGTARHEQAHARPPAAARELLRILRSVIEGPNT